MRPLIVPTPDANSETAMVNAWYVRDGAFVDPGDVVAEVETSKAVLDVVAPDEGYVLRATEAGHEHRLAEPLAYLFPSLDELNDHAARLAEAAAGANGANGIRATAPARRRAGELGIDLAALAGQHVITVPMVEAAAADGARAAATELPMPLEAQDGVQRIALIGAGLGATQVIDILSRGGTQQAVAIVDDDPGRWADRVEGVPVVGGVERLDELHQDGRFDAVIVAISTSVPARTRLRELCEGLGIPLADAIDPSARLNSGVQLGRGNVICAFCHLGVGTRVGENNFLSAYNSFDHHNVLGSDISTGPGCMTSGLVRVGDRVRLGTGIFVQPHVELGAGVEVASGAVIVNSVPAGHAVKRRVTTMATVPLRAPSRNDETPAETGVS